MTQVAVCLPSRCKALSSNFSTAKKKKKKRKKEKEKRSFLIKYGLKSGYIWLAHV
jgi:hypothetical protein